jgi:hypothetical protein
MRFQAGKRHVLNSCFGDVTGRGLEYTELLLYTGVRNGRDMY